MSMNKLERCGKQMTLSFLKSQINPIKFLFVSHRWDDKDDPDPNSDQLHLIKRFLNLNPSFKFVFYDFSCMWQNPRSPKQDEEFKNNLLALSEVVTKCSTLILHSPDYSDRGWCLMELYSSFVGGGNFYIQMNHSIEYIIRLKNLINDIKVSSIIKLHNMDMSGSLNHDTLNDLMSGWSEHLMKEIESLKFTNGSDIDIIRMTIFKSWDTHKYISQKGEYQNKRDDFIKFYEKDLINIEEDHHVGYMLPLLMFNEGGFDVLLNNSVSKIPTVLVEKYGPDLNKITNGLRDNMMMSMLKKMFV